MTNVLTAELTAPGGWLAAVIPGRLAVVHLPDPDADSIARLWAALGDDDGMRRVLDELTRKGLAATPRFVLAEWTGEGDAVDGRFIVRGEAGVAIETDAGAEDITASGVSTWVERPVSGVRGFRVECVPAEPAAAPALPIAVGAVWVSAVSFGSAAGRPAAAPDDIRGTEWVPAEHAGSLADAKDGSAGSATDTAAVASQQASGGSRTAEPHPVDDLDRTIADLEQTMAGEDALEPPDALAGYDVASPVAPAVGDVPHETTAYDHLFGATMMRSVEDAAARPQADDTGDESPASNGPAAPPAAPAPPAALAAQESSVPPVASAPAFTPASPVAPASQQLGDHDGLTVLSGDLRALRESAGNQQAASEGQEPAASIEASSSFGKQEDRGFTLKLPDGHTEPIDGMVVVGRAPSVSKMGGGRVPRLVTVDSVEHDISRNHVQLTVEGGTVVVTDLHSRNGTLIALPGKAPQKLRAGEPTSVIAGTVIDLGSGVTLDVVQA
jgi:hypothetical protein